MRRDLWYAPKFRVKNTGRGLVIMKVINMLRFTRFNPQTHSAEMERYRLVNPYCMHHSAIVHYSHTTGI